MEAKARSFTVLSHLSAMLFAQLSHAIGLNEAWVEVDGEWREMVFITNNIAWSPRSVSDLYRRRWDIEVFFKQVKQSLKLSGFPGHNANAGRWQVYAALPVYVLLRFQAHLSNGGVHADHGG